MKTGRLLDALGSLAKQQKLNTDDKSKRPTEIIRDELADLIPEFLEEIFKLANIPEIEKRISDARKFNKEGLQKILQIIKEAKPPNYELKFKDGSREIDTDKLINEIQNHINILAEKGSKWSPIEIILRVEMSLDKNFGDLLMSFDNKNSVFDEIADVLVSHLNLLSKDELLLLWSRVLNQFKTFEHIEGLRVYPNITPSVRKQASKVIVFLHPFNRAKIDHGLASPVVVSGGSFSSNTHGKVFL